MGDSAFAPLRIVSIGGGTGLSTLLRGVKRYTQTSPGAVDITAVVTVTDDGGSSGRLRRDFDVLPPGDIRTCMVALSADEALLSRLFQYRFSSGRGLKGHSFGNLFLTAMTHLMGDFAQAVKFSSEVLAVNGRIYPSTAENVRLRARLADGSTVRGETRISSSASRIERIELEPRRVRPLGETLEAIARADLITLGPGSLFTSVIPNMLVEGIPQAIAASPATKAFFMNLMSQPGETTGFRASDHLAAVLAHCNGAPRGASRKALRHIIDICVINTRRISGKVLEKYRAAEARPIENDTEALERMGVKVVGEDLMRMGSHRVPDSPGYKIRHDPRALGATVLDLALQARRTRRKTA
jgi:uncharacterized cofD-like protein